MASLLQCLFYPLGFIQNALLLQRTFLGAKDDDADELLGVGEKGGEREVLLHYARNVLLDGGHSGEEGRSGMFTEMHKRLGPRLRDHASQLARSFFYVVLLCIFGALTNIRVDRGRGPWRRAR